MQISWAELADPIERCRAGHSGAVTSVQHLIDMHARYVAVMQERTLLAPSAARIQEMLRAVLGEVFSFANQLALQPNAARDPVAFDRLSRTYDKFSGLVAFLIKLLSEMLRRGPQPHLEELALKLDFNGWYSAQ
jgi:hypothetical protein